MPEFASLPLLIEPVDLLERLSMPMLTLVDLGSAERYQQLHISNAINIVPKQIQSHSGLPGLLPDRTSLERLFASLGYQPGTTYVVYDDEGGGWAGRFIWILDSIGHQKYHYLNGGLRAWMQEGYKLSNKLPDTELTTANLTIDPQPTATLSYLLERLGSNDLVIWDARSADEFRGEKVLAANAGHIPGAVNLEWTLAMDATNGMRIKADIRECLKQLGITKDKEIITYCQSHHRSGFTYLIAKVLGYPRVKAYAGSWSEWGNTPHMPIED